MATKHTTCRTYSRYKEKISPCTFLKTFILVVTLLVSGCGAKSIDITDSDRSELREIHYEFQHIVEKAKANKKTAWHSGWIGNVIINVFRGDNKGLCYHWQEHVYRSILPTVHLLDWEAQGISINKATWFEHNAVLVYDPKTIKLEEILNSPETAPAYVLDAWRRGRADIFLLDDWLDLPLVKKSGIQLENIRTN